MTSVDQIGNRLVSLCRAGQGTKALDTLYATDIVSVEAEGSPKLPARLEGIEAIRGKNEWWYGNHEIHASKAAGPFRGPREDQFAVYFETDVTFKPTGERQRMEEMGLYTVSGDRIVREDFWPLRSA